MTARLPTEVEAIALALPTTLMLDDCDVNIRKITFEDERGRTKVLGYKSLCRTHWAESPICSSKLHAIDMATEHAAREANIEKAKKGDFS